MLYTSESKSKAVIGAVRKIEDAFFQFTDFPAKEVKSGLNGTITIHGIFFAHDPEPGAFKRPFARLVTGTKKEEYYPVTEQEIEAKWKNNNAWVR